MHTEPEETWGFEDSLYAAEVLADQHFGAVGIYDTCLLYTSYVNAHPL